MTPPNVSITVLMDRENPGDMKKEEIKSRKGRISKDVENSISKVPSTGHLQEMLKTVKKMFFCDQFRELLG